MSAIRACPGQQSPASLSELVSLGAVEEDGVHGEWGLVYVGSDGLFKGLVA